MKVAPFFCLLLAMMLLIVGIPMLHAVEIGFDEEFSLADDRSLPLKQLIPGTEDYYYYNCLYRQLRGETGEVAGLLKQWVNRYGHSTRYEEIRTRQVLLGYASNPERVLQFIVERLNLLFNHAKIQPVASRSFASRMPDSWLDYQSLKQAALREYNDLSGFKYPGIEALLADDLTGDRRRDLLNRLQYPDNEKIAQMIVDDLNHQYSGGFGSLPIHSRLLPEQLAFCSKAMPQLLDQSNFIMVCLQKMQPGADSRWENDPQQKLQHLKKMYAFVNPLKPVFNSLKAHLLYNILDLQRGLGEYDRTAFLEYLKLPRSVSYIDRKRLESDDWLRYQADLSADFNRLTKCPPVVVDEPLVRDFLSRLLLKDESADAFSGIIESEYLKRLFAETMIVNAVGDLEKWFSLLDGQMVKELKERVELEFLPVCRPVYESDEPVAISVRIKNVSRLMLKIYKLNLANYYRNNNAEISTAIDLDGLVANDELSFDYPQPSYHRHDETFALPGLQGRGVYIVELIGNGISSRAMIRRGQLSFIQRPGAAGHVFTIFDEKGVQVKDALIQLAGSEYKAGKDGQIVVPYTTSPGNRKFVVVHGDFAALHNFEHQAENYRLEAAFHVDREALLAGKNATVLVRPALSVNACPVDIGLLKEVSLLITSTDRDGVASTREVSDIELFNDRETAYEFKTPEKLRAIVFSLRGKVDNLSRGSKDELNTSRNYSLNGIDSSEKTQALFVKREAEGYVVELLGKTGECCSDRVINLELSHRLFRRNISGTLQTDEKGRIYLGKLENIEWVKLSAPEADNLEFVPETDLNKYVDKICVPEGQEVRIPATGNVDEKVADLCCLYEVYEGLPTRDCRSTIVLEPGFFTVKGLAAGDYEFYLKRLQQKILIKVAAGPIFGGYVVSKSRGLPLNNSRPLQITEAVARDGNLRIKLANAGKNARVHVVASQFRPDFRPFYEFSSIDGPVYPEIQLNQPISRYVSGRNIGDEYRYILDRRFAKIFPGNMLKRPGLLLNPWSLQKTDTGTQQANAGGNWSGESESAGQIINADDSLKKKREKGALQSGGFAAYDFLANPVILKANMRPDADGGISVDLKELKGQGIIQIVALDGFDTACREVVVDSKSEPHNDLRLKNVLEPAKHFSQQKRISVLSTGESFTVADISTARVEVYDSIKSAFRLLSTVNPDQNLARFSFITGWGALDNAKKLEFYAKNACHELNFFVYNRDRSFFEATVKPYIANKRDKTFLDKWLLDLDLHEFIEPWAFARLNIVEKILLGQKVPEIRQTIERHVQEKFDLLPDDRELFNRLFKTALQGNALELGDKLGFETGKQDYERSRAAMKDMGGDMPVPEPAPMELAGGMSAKPSVRSARPMAPAPPPPPGKAMLRESKANLAPASEEFSAGDFDENLDLESDSELREEVQQLFRQVDKTEEWVENNYFQLPVEQQLSDLIKVNAFWRDYAMHEPGKPFISGNFIFATGNFAEMMLALAVLDLPFDAAKHESVFTAAQMSLKVGCNSVLFTEEIGSAREASDTASILTGQNFFALNDRYRYERNERFDKFVTDEFLTRQVYGCQVVVTNPTSSRRKVDVLMQIPEGALPVLNSQTTRSIHLQIEPYSTQTSEYYFYFPAAGKWRHYPVHVSEDEVMLAAARPFVFNVVEKLTSFDRTSWPWLSQNGSNEEVLRYLAENNVERLDLTQMAFRLKDREFFIAAHDLLKKRHVFNEVIWSYGLLHSHLPAIREYLPHTSLAAKVGSSFVCELFEVDPIRRHLYQHREYWPLVNARVYPLGRKREILNQQFANQYHALLADLRYRNQLSDYDLLAVVYYLLLQDRIEEAMKFFVRIDDPTLVSTIQYQYMKAYLAFSDQKISEAVKIAEQFRDYPVERWKALFADVLAQAAEINGGAVTAGDQEDRDQKQRLLAAAQPDIELNVENRIVTLRHKNLKMAKISYYLMDIELLFSRKPFVQEVSGQFSIISPNHSEEIQFEGQPEKIRLALPEKFRDRNLMIEISGGGLTRSVAYYPHSLSVSMIESFGQVQVRHQETEKPVVSAYIKVYARLKDGQVVFYKDGYTDMRGRFDYASLSTSQLDNVEKFAVLIMSESAGSLIREAAPPNL